MARSKLKALRQEREWSQDQVAKALNITQAYLSMIESGKRKPGRQLYSKLIQLFETDEIV